MKKIYILSIGVLVSVGLMDGSQRRSSRFTSYGSYGSSEALKTKKPVLSREQERAKERTQERKRNLEREKEKETEFYEGVRLGDVEQVRTALYNGAKVNALLGRYKTEKNTALLVACQVDKGFNVKLIQLLLEQKADPNQGDFKERTPLWWLARKRRDTPEIKKAVGLLIAYGADPYLKDQDGQNAFTVASKEMKVVMKKAIDAYRLDTGGRKKEGVGSDVRVPMPAKQVSITPTVVEEKEERRSELRPPRRVVAMPKKIVVDRTTLHSQHSSFNADEPWDLIRTNDKNDVDYRLLEAVKTGAPKDVQNALRHPDVNPNMVSLQGYKDPLMIICESEHPSVEKARLLLEAGANPHGNVYAPLWMLAKRSHVPEIDKIIELLIEYGADPYAKDIIGRNAFSGATTDAKNAMLRALAAGKMGIRLKDR